MKIKHTIARSVRGISHSKSGMPNQDSILLQVNGCHQLVAAVADGHGSSNCFRSNKGSRFATEIFATVAKEIPEFTNIDEARLFAENLPGLLVKQWKNRIDDDLIISPYASHEISEMNAENCYLPFGCTFLGCYIGLKYAIFLQIGDGDMFAEFNGETKYLVPEDDRLNGNATTSLCLPNAENDFRVSVIDLADVLVPEIIILATDGLGQSYANDSELFKWGTDLKEIYTTEEGVRIIETDLSTWLDDVSTSASTDDISMVLICLEKEEITQYPDKQTTLNDLMRTNQLYEKRWFSLFRNKKKIAKTTIKQ